MKHLEAQSNSESTFRVLHQVHAFFISQVKVDTSRHRICFRWHYVLISSFAFLITFHSSKFFLLASPAETAHAAIIAQCRSREQFQSGGTPQGHLVQPAAPARTKCSIRSGSGGLFFFRQSVKIYSSRDWLQPVAVPCHSSPAGIFLSLGLTEFSLTETCACGLLSSHCKGGQTLSPL